MGRSKELYIETYCSENYENNIEDLLKKNEAYICEGEYYYMISDEDYLLEELDSENDYYTTINNTLIKCEDE